MKKRLVILFCVVLLIGIISSVYFLTDGKFSLTSIKKTSPKQESIISSARSFNPEDERNIGYEFLDDGKVVHIWNTQDDYFFDKSSGIQLTNHYENYWTRNIFCIGYYSGEEWIKIKCADELTDFNKNIQTDDLTYVNATLWKDFTYGDYNLRLGVNYYLGLDDKNLSITVYGKNIGTDIPYDLGLAWKVANINIPDSNGKSQPYGDSIEINSTRYNLSGYYDLTFKNMSHTYTNWTINEAGESVNNGEAIEYDSHFRLQDWTKFLKIDWNENLNYAVKMYGNGNQENFYVALLINAGHFNPNQEKSTTLHWIDAEGDYLDSFSVAGEGLADPVVIAASDEFIWVGEYASDLVHKYFRNGTYTGINWTVHANQTNMYGMGYYNGFIWIADDITNSVFKYFENGTYAGVGWLTHAGCSAGCPSGVAFDGTYVRVSDSINDVIHKYFPNGTYIDSFDYTPSGLEDVWGLSYFGGYFYLNNLNGYNMSRFFEDGTYIFGWNFTAANDAVWGNAARDFIWSMDRTDDVVYRYVSVDTISPTYSNNQTNNTNAGQSTLFSILYDDNSFLHPNGQYIFSTNNTGTWTNDSAVNFTITPNWANVTKTLNSTVGTVVGYRWFADDNVGNINNTPIYILTTVDTAAPAVTLNYPIDYYNSSSNSITFNGTASDNIDLENVSLYGNWTGTWALNETNSSPVNNAPVIFDKTISDGTHIWNYYACDGSSNCGFSTDNRTFNIDTTAPVINITYPTAKVNYHLINTNLSLNWTVSDAHLDSCWYNYNGTNITVTCLDNHTNINITEDLNRNVTFYANDTYGNLNSFYREWDYRVFEVQQTFSPTTIEGSTETFISNIFLGSGETITEINMNYNGTDKSAGYLSLGGNEYNLSSTFIIPSVVSETNVSFFWKIILISDQINSSSRNQTVKSVSIDDCSVFSNVIFNYTIIDEESQGILSNGTLLELDIEMFDASKTVSILNFSKEYKNVNPAIVCLSINLTNDTIYALDSVVKYESTNYTGNQSVNYSIEYYNIQNFSLQNSTIPQEINLFDLKLVDTTEFQITFKDSNFVAVENALIQINRQYLSEGLFKTVEIPKTDANGQTVAHLVEKDIVYNIIVLKEGEIIGTFNNIIAFCEDVLIGSCFITLNALVKGEVSFDYDADIGLFYEFEYNETSRNLQFDFSTTDGSVKNVTLSALKIDQLGNDTVCDGFLVSSSGSIFCPVPVSVGNETIIVSVFVEGDLKITNYVQAGREFDIGDAGYFLMFFLVLSLALMMTQSKTGVIIGVILGFISGVLLSFVQGGLVGIGSSVIWLIIMGVILIYKLNSQGQT